MFDFALARTLTTPPSVERVAAGATRFIKMRLTTSGSQ